MVDCTCDRTRNWRRNFHNIRTCFHKAPVLANTSYNFQSHQLVSSTYPHKYIGCCTEVSLWNTGYSFHYYHILSSLSHSNSIMNFEDGILPNKRCNELDLMSVLFGNLHLLEHIVFSLEWKQLNIICNTPHYCMKCSFVQYTHTQASCLQFGMWGLCMICIAHIDLYPH